MNFEFICGLFGWLGIHFFKRISMNKVNFYPDFAQKWNILFGQVKWTLRAHFWVFFSKDSPIASLDVCAHLSSGCQNHFMLKLPPVCNLCRFLLKIAWISLDQAFDINFMGCAPSSWTLLMSQLIYGIAGSAMACIRMPGNPDLKSWKFPNFYLDSFSKFLSRRQIWVQVGANFIWTWIWVTQYCYFRFFYSKTPIFHTLAPQKP